MKINLFKHSTIFRHVLSTSIAIVLSVVVSSCANLGNAVNQKGITTSDLDKPNTVVYLTRHAEKQPTKIKDPELSAKGEETAKRLATYLQNSHLDVIYSTPFKRTRNTAKAVANQQDKDITELFLPAHEMARLITDMHSGQTILVVGHSNTTPALITQLGVSDKIEIAEDQFGELFIVTLNKGSVVSFKRVAY